MTGFRNQGKDLLEEYVTFNEVDSSLGASGTPINLPIVFSNQFRNLYGELGLGSTLGSFTPNDSGNSNGFLNTKQLTWSQVSINYNAHTKIIKADGTMWSTGRNISGALGLGDTINRSIPTQIGTLNTWSKVYTIGAVKTDGTLWAWGYNTSGQLGLGDLVHRSSPVQVGSLSSWSSITSDFRNSMSSGIVSPGSLWVWGSNVGTYVYGGATTIRFLGLGAATGTILSPVQLGTNTDWASIKTVSGTNPSGGGGGLDNGVSFFGIRRGGASGTLWSWGLNAIGQLGLGDTTTRSSPTQVGSLTDWAFVTGSSSSIFGFKTNGTLWTWGFNSAGQLGLGDVTHRSSPVQVGSLTNWGPTTTFGDNNRIAFISGPGSGGIGTNSGAAVIKNDGTLWEIGSISNGFSGFTKPGPLHSSPIQVGSLTSWKSASNTQDASSSTILLRSFF